MISFTTLAMIGWIPLILVSFSLLTPRRAIIAAYIVGWMFLPVISWDLPGLPQYDKTTATNLGLMVAILLFDLQSLVRFTPGAADVPVLILCLCPIGSSLSNGFGLYDGISGAWGQIVTWGIPWVVGRCYFGNLSALRELAIGMFIGAVAYIPLCLFEMQYGAILHLRVYGYYQHSPEQTVRPDGSIRPMVFMQHGLMLAMWMGSSALAGMAVSRDIVLRNLPVRTGRVLAAALVVTAFLCHSTGATVLVLLGLGMWFGMHSLRIRLPIILLVALVPAYMVLRSTGIVKRSDLAAALSAGLETAGVSPEDRQARLESAQTRFDAEDRLASKALLSPMFGLGRMGNLGPDPFVDSNTGERTLVPFDGLWIILLTTRGIMGLSAWTAMMLIPVLLFLRLHPAEAWRSPLVCIAGVLSLVLLLYTVDCLLNAMFNPIYSLIAGGLVGVLPLGRAGARVRQRGQLQSRRATLGERPQWRS